MRWNRYIAPSYVIAPTRRVSSRIKRLNKYARYSTIGSSVHTPDPRHSRVVNPASGPYRRRDRINLVVSKYYVVKDTHCWESHSACNLNMPHLQPFVMQICSKIGPLTCVDQKPHAEKYATCILNERRPLKGQLINTQYSYKTHLFLFSFIHWAPISSGFLR
jgi:hypothetical protein